MSRRKLAVLALIALFTAAVVSYAQRLPDGPQPIAWDRAACTHCHMLIGDPRFAAQLVTRDGEVLSFDDPGCLQAYLAERHPAIHRLWYRHVAEDRWLEGRHVAFVAADHTPMGYGLGAVDEGTPGSRPAP